MKGFERVFYAWAVFAVTVIVLIGLFGASEAFGAGGLFEGNWMNGNFGFQGVSWSSSSSANGDSVSGNFSLNLDAQKFSVESMNWNFYTNSYDPGWWAASCYLHGRRDSSEPWPQNQSWSQNVATEGVSINAYLSLYSSYNSWQEKPEVQLYGSINVSPSVLLSSNFSWYETQDAVYSYPNGWDNEPVITYYPAWQGVYQLSGRMQLQDTPEPSTGLLAAFGIVGIAFFIRRRSK